MLADFIFPSAKILLLLRGKVDLLEVSETSSALQAEKFHSAYSLYISISKNPSATSWISGFVRSPRNKKGITIRKVSQCLQPLYFQPKVLLLLRR